MPIYEYQCPDCGFRFEKLQKISDDPITVCPECGGEQVKKLVSQSAFILKGSGWYKDHYGLKKGGSDSSSTGGASTSSKSPATASAPSSSSSDAGSSGSSSSDSSTSAPSKGSTGTSSGKSSSTSSGS